MLRYFFLLILFSQFVYCQPNNSLGFNEQLDREQLHREHTILFQAIESIHPNQNLFLPKDSFEFYKSKLMEGTDQGLSTDEWHIRIRQFLRKIGCGHTIARPSELWYNKVRENGNFLPFKIFIADKKAYIKTAYDRDSLLRPGMELLAIDNKSFPDIYAHMQSIQERDGTNESYEKLRIQRLFTTYYLFLYGLNEQYSLTVINNSDTIENLIIYPGKPRETPEAKPVESLVDLTANDAHFYIAAENPDLAILNIDGFSRKGFKKFYKNVFRELKNRNIDNLVVDLRNNSGGYFPNGNNLLKYLLNEKFNMYFNHPKLERKMPAEVSLTFSSRMTNMLFNLMPDRDRDDPRRNYELKIKPNTKYGFDGTLYVLINEGTFSLGSYVSTYLKKNEKALFIGSETGGGEFGSNALIRYNLDLPESGIRVVIPYYFMDHKIEKNDHWGSGVLPDYNIKYGIDDLLSGRDKVMEKAVELSGYDPLR